MRIIISGGGTGGHIYPAIAIANEIKSQHPNAQILFVGAEGKMEMEKVPKAGYEIKGLWISGIERKISFGNVIKNLLFPLKITNSIVKAYQIVKNFNPDAVIGVGGYASGAVLYVAGWLKIPTLIQEQNSFAGLTNRLLGKEAHKICVAYPNMEKFFPKEKIAITGNPVRSDIANLVEKREKAQDFFTLDKTKKTLLIVGGSLGAKSINESISAGLEKLTQKNIQVIWQTGKNPFEIHPKQTALEQNIAHKIYRTEFIYEMDLAYACADVVISRAGALAVSELCIAQKPTIFVPFPFATDDHQTKNAYALTQAEAGELVKDSEARLVLVDKVLDLLENETKQQLFAKNIQQFAKPDATKEIVNFLTELVIKNH